MKSRKIIARDLADKFFFHNNYDYFWKYSKGVGYIAHEKYDWEWTQCPMVPITELKEKLGWKEARQALVESLLDFVKRKAAKKTMEKQMEAAVAIAKMEAENPLLS